MSNPDMLREFVHIGITGTHYHPLYMREIGVWVFARSDDTGISLPGFHTTENIAKLCNIDDEELVFIKLKYCC